MSDYPWWAVLFLGLHIGFQLGFYVARSIYCPAAPRGDEGGR